MSSFQSTLPPLRVPTPDNLKCNVKANILSIEGNIGSGKSTLMEELKKVYENNPNIVFLKEPVDEWNNICDKDGNTMLSKFYADQKKYSFSFQMMAYISRLAVIKNSVQNNPNCVFISERCLYTDKHVFAKMLFNQGKIEDVDYQIYNKWFDTFTDEFNINNIVYIKTNPDICKDRINQRSREGEDSIPIEYLSDCHEYHNNMMEEMKCDIMVLNGNENIKTNPSTLNKWVYQINDLIRKIGDVSPQMGLSKEKNE